jgi:hypothetical protein
MINNNTLIIIKTKIITLTSTITKIMLVITLIISIITIAHVIVRWMIQDNHKIIYLTLLLNLLLL